MKKFNYFYYKMPNREVKLILHHAKSQFVGYGHYRITVELEYKNIYQKFHAITTDIHKLDEVKEIENWEDKILALYEMIDYKIEERIREWLYFLED